MRKFILKKVPEGVLYICFARGYGIPVLGELSGVATEEV
jgi:hypothetical protein